jgi:phytoene dehydrogenase-like protein
MAWFLVADMIEGLDSGVFRLRNKEYMDAFTTKLTLQGVEILTGVTASKLIARDVTGVRVLVGSERVLHADKIVLAMPPNAAVEFLGYHLNPHESTLTKFDCRSETVVLHQDPKWVISDSKGVLFGLMPDKKEPLPLRDATIPLTTSTISGT